MDIQSVKYANSDQSMVLVNGLHYVPWPCSNWYREPIQEWLDGGNTITPYAKYDSLWEAQAGRIAEINRECTRRITTKWPLEKQHSCALGVYPPAEAEQCADDIAAMVAASNESSDAVDAATTIDEVEAVAPVWPVI